MNDVSADGWDELEHAAADMFNVWVDGNELQWAREAWGHLHAAGLTSGETVLDLTAARLRLVTLARIYQEFCGFAWEENPETPVEYLAENLEIDGVALGVLAASRGGVRFDGAEDEYDLREMALIAVTNSQRKEIFKCLSAAYGDEFKLYSRLYHTRSDEAEEDTEYEEFDVTAENCQALQYVISGFRYG